MRKIAILGSTGSIGTQALDVIARHPDRFRVVGLAAGRNQALLREQVERFAPRIATSIDDGPIGLRRVAVDTDPDIVLAATDGAVAFDAVFAAIERGIDIAVANKELIVAAGELLMASAAHSGSRILPVDSEHSAIFQCLVGESTACVDHIIVTASGGPFWRMSRAEMDSATLDAALAHPTWQMGTKNTIDSATMMNKGLEIIEASRLFGIPGDRLHIAVHPQSIAHGFVVFTDGSVKGQLCAPDMRVPIGYALAYPDRLAAPSTARFASAQDDKAKAASSAPCPERAEGAAPRPEWAEGAAPRPEWAEGAPRPEWAEGSAACPERAVDPTPCHPERAVGPVEGRSADVLAMLGGKPQETALRYTFERPDPERFPCVRLAYEALSAGGTVPAVLSAANEVAVASFVEGKISFGAIARVIETTMTEVERRPASLQAIREADARARLVASAVVEGTVHSCS